MNFVIISPHFPKTFWQFAEALKKNGFNVLGIGDAPFSEIDVNLKRVLSEYYYCPKMDNYDELYKAFAFFAFKYGKIDWVESNNEYWLAKDARLRSDFNIRTGLDGDHIIAYKSKSEMKKYYSAAGVKTARYVMGDDIMAVREFAKVVGYPLFAKPDIGVGANSTYRIASEEHLVDFFARKDAQRYIIEEFLDGTIISFDGVCDSRSEPVLYLSHLFPVPNDIAVNEIADDYYYSLYDVPADLEALGRATLKAFDVGKRFFHLEFFRLNRDKQGLGKAGDIVGLEVNMRPPGGYTTEMISHCLGVSCYQAWADVIAYDENRQGMKKDPSFVVESARRDNHVYAHTREDILQLYQAKMIMEGRYPPIISVGMGDSFFIAKFSTFAEADLFRHYVLERK